MSPIAQIPALVAASVSEWTETVVCRMIVLEVSKPVQLQERFEKGVRGNRLILP